MRNIYQSPECYLQPVVHAYDAVALSIVYDLRFIVI